MCPITASIAERRLSSSSTGSVSPTGGMALRMAIGPSINILVDLEGARGSWPEKLAHALSNAIGPSAVVSAMARIGRGAAVMASAVINAEAQIDDFRRHQHRQIDKS